MTRQMLWVLGCMVLASASAAIPSPPSQLPWFNPKLPTSERVAALVASLSLEQKVSQLVTGAAELPTQHIPAYMWRNNVLHGLVDNGVSTQFPQATGLAATWNITLLREVGGVCATEQRAKHNIATNFDPTNASPMNYGLDLWGPNINMFRDSRWGRGQETYGEDPVLSGAMGSAFITGLQNGSVPGYYKTIATAKHFDAYSLDRMPPRLSFDPTITQQDLMQYYLPAFADVVDAGVKSIMCSYNGVNGYPMCMSPMIEAVLRGDMKFDGYVVTDSGAVDFFVSEFKRFDNLTYAAAASLNAGVDLNSGSAFLHLVNATAQGLVSEQRVTEAVARVMQARIELGLFDPPEMLGPYAKYNASDILSAEHRALALEAAEQSIVLLRNERAKGDTAPLLPLRLPANAVVSVVGPGANDTFRQLGNYYGCSFGSWGPVLANCSISTPLDGVRALVGDQRVLYTPGCEQESNDTTGFAQAVANAKASDVVIAVMGLRNCEGGQGKGGANCESEGHDRTELGLPGVQQALLQRLLAVNARVVLVLTNGGPVATTWASANIPAMVDAWYSGVAGGAALANILFGVDGKAPAGKLPFMVPMTAADLPPDTSMDLTAAPHGRTYRYFNGTALYNFGFGLTYGDMVYSDVSVVPGHMSVQQVSAKSTIHVCCVVTNAGNFSSADVVQVYASRIASTEADAGLYNVPRVQLLAFTRMPVLATATHQTVCVDAVVAKLDLVGGDGTLAAQPGHYILHVGGTAPGAQGAFVTSTRQPLQIPFEITK